MVVSYFIKYSSCSAHSTSLRTTFRRTCSLQCCWQKDTGCFIMGICHVGSSLVFFINIDYKCSCYFFWSLVRYICSLLHFSSKMTSLPWDRHADNLEQQWDTFHFVVNCLFNYFSLSLFFMADPDQAVMLTGVSNLEIKICKFLSFLPLRPVVGAL